MMFERNARGFVILEGSVACTQRKEWQKRETRNRRGQELMILAVGVKIAYDLFGELDEKRKLLKDGADEPFSAILKPED